MKFTYAALFFLAPSLSAQVSVPVGTRVQVITAAELSSKTAKHGDTLTFNVDSDVVVNGYIVIAKGAAVRATVSNAEPAGRFGHAGKLVISIDSVVATDHSYIRLKASLAQTTNAANGSSIVDMIPGASALGFFHHGDDITIKPGTRVAVFTLEDANVTVSGKLAAHQLLDSAGVQILPPTVSGVALFYTTHTYDMALAALAVQRGSDQAVRDLGKLVVHDDSILRDQEVALAKQFNTPVTPMGQDDQTKLKDMLTTLGGQQGKDFDKAVLQQMHDLEQGFVIGIDEDDKLPRGQLLNHTLDVWRAHISQIEQLLGAMK